MCCQEVWKRPWHWGLLWARVSNPTFFKPKEALTLRLLTINNNDNPYSRKNLSTFQTFCPVGVQFVQTVVQFAHFHVQARKRGVLFWGWGCLVYIDIRERALRRLSKEQGLRVVLWAKWDPYGQNETHMGNLCEKWAKVLKNWGFKSFKASKSVQIFPSKHSRTLTSSEFAFWWPVRVYATSNVCHRILLIHRAHWNFWWLGSITSNHHCSSEQ